LPTQAQDGAVKQAEANKAVARRVNGKIVENCYLTDSLGHAEQLGTELAPGDAAK
jgi:hypothetical protein